MDAVPDYIITGCHVNFEKATLVLDVKEESFKKQIIFENVYLAYLLMNKKHSSFLKVDRSSGMSSIFIPFKLIPL